MDFQKLLNIICITQSFMLLQYNYLSFFLNHLMNVQRRILNIYFIEKKTHLEFLASMPHLRHYLRKPRRIWMKCRNRGYWSNFVSTSSDDEWIETFRMSKETFFYISDQLSDHLQPCFQKLCPREPLSVDEQVAICIYYLGSCCEYRVVGDVFGVHKSTVWKCVHRVSNQIIETLMPLWIKMPNKEECEIISAAFEAKSNIPQVISVIDGSHIPIRPPKIGYTDYINRRGWPSIVLQGVVDHKMIFRNINCQSPGSTHDATVLRNSNLFNYHDLVIPEGHKVINGVKVPYIIIGDPAYPLLPWLMKNYTYTKKITPEQDSFNAYMNKIRVTVEMAYGRLKGRWRILSKTIDVHPSFAPELIAVCCVLHNIVESKQDYFDIRWLENANQQLKSFPQPLKSETNTSTTKAELIRDTLMTYLKKFPSLQSMRWKKSRRYN